MDEIDEDRTSCSQTVAWNENENEDEKEPEKERREQSHAGTLIQQTTNVRLANALPIHEGILAESDEGQDGIDGVLIRHNTV